MKSKLPAPSAKDINEAHRLAHSTAQIALGHATRCGQLLAKVKDDLDRGDFDGWVKKNCDFGRAMAYNYIKAAKSPDTLGGSAIRHLFPSGRSGAKQTAKSSNALDDSSTGAAALATFHPPGVAKKGPSPAVALTPVTEPEADEPERPDDIDEDAALASAEADYTRRVDAVMAANDALTEMRAQLKQQAALIGTLEMTRDGYMRGKEAVTKLLQAEQRKTLKLEKDLAKARDENESLRERLAIMEAA